MKLAEKSINGLTRGMYYIAGVAIVVMMLLTCADVALRFCVTVYHAYGLNFLESFKPIPGTYELVGFLGTVAVSFAMAHTSVTKGHVAVSMLVRLLPEKVQAIIGTVTDSLGLFFFAMIAWQSVVYANDLQMRGEVSLTLQLPFYPFVYGVGFAAASVCLVLLVDLSKNLIKMVSR